MTTVIVGNGPSLKDRELGKKIDSFERVVRINAAEVKGYEHQVGSKTDVLVINERFLWYGDEIRIKNVPLLVAVCWWQPLHGCLWQRIAETTDLPLIDEDVARESSPYDRGKWPSTGMLAIAHFMRRGTVAIAGFDHFKGGPHHYFNDSVPASCHDGEDEAFIVQAWQAEGGLYRL